MLPGETASGDFPPEWTPVRRRGGTKPIGGRWRFPERSQFEGVSAEGAMAWGADQTKPIPGESLRCPRREWDAGFCETKPIPVVSGVREPGAPAWPGWRGIPQRRHRRVHRGASRGWTGTGVELHLAARRPKAWLCPIRRPRPRVLVGKSDCIRDSLGPLKLQRFSEGALLKLKPVISRRPLKLRRF